jgi:hypothetical protein
LSATVTSLLSWSFRQGLDEAGEMSSLMEG